MIDIVVLGDVVVIDGYPYSAIDARAIADRIHAAASTAEQHARTQRTTLRQAAQILATIYGVGLTPCKRNPK